jgi:predicted adenine nucleotide alpha hydrolase (AANH) superfamily ATPase
VLVHICCSVDSHFFLEELQKKYPDEKLIGYFYDPNIHPYSEYKLRLLDVQRSCKKLNIELLVGEYDFDEWYKLTQHLYNEKEKSTRCKICFDKRLQVSMKKASEIGESKVTTTLLVSPLKSQQQLIQSAKDLSNEYNVEFVFEDFRSFGGTNLQSSVSKEEKLYRQDYCGCMFGLINQRKEQNIFLDEFISSINKQILSASVDERLEFYQKRLDLEEQNIEYVIRKEKFLNYRLFNFKMFVDKEQSLHVYPLIYSTLKRKKTKGKIELIAGDIGYFNREEIKFITIEYFNKLTCSDFKDTLELSQNPIKYQEEIKLREVISTASYDLSPIIVVDQFHDGKIEIELDSLVYEDTKEILLYM